MASVAATAITFMLTSANGSSDLRPCECSCQIPPVPAVPPPAAEKLEAPSAQFAASPPMPPDPPKSTRATPSLSPDALPTPPRVRQAKPEVTEGLDRDIIRRIVRAHINEVRYCYNEGLERDPDLRGRVSIRFKITPNGRVGETSVEASSLGDTKVETCVEQAVQRWKFPKPQNGESVVVTYPFVLSPG